MITTIFYCDDSDNFIGYYRRNRPVNRCNQVSARTFRADTMYSLHDTLHSTRLEVFFNEQIPQCLRILHGIVKGFIAEIHKDVSAFVDLGSDPPGILN
ncbi:MAG: hypothetical protein HY796_00230 [Elusimicrobia bacterium]|nr:hypothetical protein [Elusimicrobiota bacterium]